SATEPKRGSGQERLDAVFDRSLQRLPQRVQPHLQSGNLLQIKTEHSQPVPEAISGGLTQGHDLTNVGRDAASQLIEKRCWNEIWRSASVVPPSSSRKLSDGVAVLAQNTPDALASILPAKRRLNIFAGFDAAKRGPCARHPKQTTDRG